MLLFRSGNDFPHVARNASKKKALRRSGALNESPTRDRDQPRLIALRAFLTVRRLVRLAVRRAFLTVRRAVRLAVRLIFRPALRTARFRLRVTRFAAFFLIRAAFLTAPFTFLTAFLTRAFRTAFFTWLTAFFTLAAAASIGVGAGAAGSIGVGAGSIQPESDQLISMSCSSAIVASSGGCRGVTPAAGVWAGCARLFSAMIRCTSLW